MIERALEKRIQATSKNVLLLGPRQVGKSTLTRSLSPGLVINLADEELFLGYSKEPARLKREIMALSSPTLIVIDEIQRVPSLLNTVQALLDAGLKHRFVLTGSSARKLKRGGANLLPGRILLEFLDPLSFWELGKLFDLETVLQRGSLPEIYLNKAEGLDILDSYTTIYLREEIQAEALSKNIGTYARFLDVAAEASGDWLNYSKIASDSEIPKETIRRFYQILEDTLVVFKINAFKPKNSKRRMSQRDRYLFFDIGVRNAILGLHRQKQTMTEKGRLFEQWFILQCCYFIHAHKLDWKLSSYRTEAGAEVDVIIDTGNKYLAIECKYGKTVTETQMKGLRSFAEIAHKPFEKYVVYQGERKQKFSGGEIAVPYDEFLREILPRHLTSS
jgi:predicted AAA+ superfamily ATPase